MSGSPSRFRTRVLVLTGLLLAAYGAILARLADLQLIRHEELARLAERQHARTVPLRPRRGPIFDRNGLALAVSTEVASVFALPRRITDPPAAAAQLARALGERPEELTARLGSDRAFVWLKRKIPPAQARAALALGLPGIGTLPEPVRFYPNRELAAHVLGFEGLDGHGLEGVELAYDRLLAGRAGLALVERDARGREVSPEATVLEPPTPGQGLVLALDAAIQHIAERELDLAWRATGARAGMVLVMEPRTGELLAVAIRPTFNPNAYQAASSEQWRNRAVTDPFEPGSTFKAILAAAALEEGVARPEDRLYGEQGAITVANRVIHDWKRYGWLTFREVLQFSSNVGAIKVAMALGRERYFRYVTAFGFGSPTGVGLPGESRGRVRPPQRWSGLSLASMAIGQEVSVTAVQLLAAFAAIANEGRLMQPRIVRAVVDAEGREVRRVPPETVRQVVSPETATTLTRILTAVVSDGTGHRAAIPGYAVAGKTGTAQKLDPVSRVYSRRPGVLSFVGFVPADAPRLAMLVMLDEPKTVAWGSEAAAPLFGSVAAQVLRYLGVPPGDGSTVQILRAAAPLDAAEGSEAGAPRGRPEPAAFADGAQVGGIEPAVAPVMPDLRGRSLRHALALLAAHEVTVEVAGRGLVRQQIPEPGAPLTPGTVCRLELAPPGAEAADAPLARGPAAPGGGTAR